MRRTELTSSVAQRAADLFLLSDCLHQSLIDHVGPVAWTLTPPGGVRTIAAIYTHVHNVRCKWVRLSAPHLALPAQLARSRCTPAAAKSALLESANACAHMLVEALGERNERIPMFHRDGWSRAWPPGIEMATYMLTHEAHHRGQVCLLAHQLGLRLPNKFTSAMWDW